MEDQPRKRSSTNSFSFSDVVKNAVEPGVNHSVMMFVNIVFLLLILTIIIWIGFSNGKLYMIVLLMLAFGLFIAFNKFVAMVVEEEKKAKLRKPELSNEGDKTD